LLHGGAKPAAKGAGKGPIPVVYSRAKKGSLPIYLNGLGIVTALNTASIHSRVDGELLQVLYQEGQTISAGQLLCEIDSRPFEAQLTQAQGAKIRDTSLWSDAKAILGHYLEVYNGSDTSSVTKAQVDTQAALVEQYAGAMKTDDGQIRAAQVNIDYCQIRAPFAGKIGLRLVDKGNIVHAADTNPLAVITQIQPIAVIFTIPEDDVPKVTEQLARREPPSFRFGLVDKIVGDWMSDVMALPVEAWDRNLQKKLATGKLLAIDNQVDQTTGMMRLKAIFDNTNLPPGESQLFPNQFVNARLLVTTLHNVIKVDSAAIQRGPDYMYVYVIKPDKTVERRTVTIGDSEGKETVVTSGLAGTEQVVTDGVDKLTNGSTVNPTRERSTTRPTTKPTIASAMSDESKGKGSKHGDKTGGEKHHGDKTTGGAE
jgi:multidrug efflux system membrane fusion protein